MPKQLKTSIVLASYNGEKYILEQLDSLKNQTRKIDEVIILDDQSTDKTVAQVESFITGNHLDNWRVIVNEENLGWRDNFMKALSLASGDIIFTCDQDDIWMPEKIEVMAKAIEENPAIGVLITDYSELLEDSGTPFKLKKIETEGESLVGKVVFSDKNVILKRPGCVFAVQKTFLPVVVEYYNQAEKSAHDISMWASALLFDKLYFLKKPLIHYRRHGDSSFQKEVTSSKRQHGIYTNRINTLIRFNVRLNSAKKFLSSNPTITSSEKKDDILSKMEEENNVRIQILQKKSIFGVIVNGFKYQHTFPFFADLYHILKLKGKRGEGNE